MIAKQGWRLIHVTRSLFAHYFPTCSFMEAVLRNNRSYVLAWQIGDGRTIGVLVAISGLTHPKWLIDLDLDLQVSKTQRKKQIENQMSTIQLSEELSGSKMMLNKHANGHLMAQCHSRRNEAIFWSLFLQLVIVLKHLHIYIQL